MQIRLPAVWKSSRQDEYVLKRTDGTAHFAAESHHTRNFCRGTRTRPLRKQNLFLLSSVPSQESLDQWSSPSLTSSVVQWEILDHLINPTFAKKKRKSRWIMHDHAINIYIIYNIYIYIYIIYIIYIYIHARACMRLYNQDRVKQSSKIFQALLAAPRCSQCSWMICSAPSCCSFPLGFAANSSGAEELPAWEVNCFLGKLKWESWMGCRNEGPNTRTIMDAVMALDGLRS